MRLKTRRPSGDWQTPSSTISCAGRPSIRLPRSVIVPCRGRSWPEIVRSVVDLPAPFDPMRVTISPSSTLSVTPRRAWIAP